MNKSLVSFMNIVLGFWEIIVVSLGCCWKYVMVIKLVFIVLFRYKIIYVILMWCVVGIVFIEFVVMKCIKMCGWLK